MDEIDILASKIQRDHLSWDNDQCEAEAVFLIEIGLEYVSAEE